MQRLVANSYGLPREDSEEAAELKAIADALEAYEARRWRLGRDPGVPRGKG